MSYDLSFYKHKDSPLRREDIVAYLNRESDETDEETTEWYFQNEDTDVYFDFALAEKPVLNDENYAEAEYEDDSPVFDDMESLDLWFHINFIRPNFFGLEGFAFVDKFVEDLGLYVYNPQSSFEDERPYVPIKGDLYENWRDNNERAIRTLTADRDTEFDLIYVPEEKTNRMWKHNFACKALQEKLGDDSFAASGFFVTRGEDKTPISVTTWTQHIPCVIPIVDRYVIIRQKKKLFRTINEQGVITYETLMREFGSFFEPHVRGESLKISIENAAICGKIFNAMPLEPFEGVKTIPVEKIVNVEF